MLDKTRQDWGSEADSLTIEGRAFINGRFENSLSGETRATTSPGDGRHLADVANCGIEDADKAVRIAREAFESGVWSNMASADRKMVLVRWAELIGDHADEIALLESLDVGKPISDTTGVDVPAAMRTIRWSGEAIDKVYDEIPPTPHDSLALVQRLPLGVVAAIVPWNFPLSTTAWKLAPSLATGNSVILNLHLTHHYLHCASPGWQVKQGCQTESSMCCRGPAVAWAATCPCTRTSMV